MQGQGMHKRQKTMQELEAATRPAQTIAKFIQSMLKKIEEEGGPMWPGRSCWITSACDSFPS